MQIFDWKQLKGSKKGQQQEQRRFWSKKKHMEKNLRTKKLIFEQTKLFLAKDVPMEWHDRHWKNPSQ